MDGQSVLQCDGTDCGFIYGQRAHGERSDADQDCEKAFCFKAYFHDMRDSHFYKILISTGQSVEFGRKCLGFQHIKEDMGIQGAPLPAGPF